MYITKTELEHKRDELDKGICQEKTPDWKTALNQANLLDALIEQEIVFDIPDYIKEAGLFLDELLEKSNLITQGKYRVYVKVHGNSHGTYYSGIDVMPYYQLTNMMRGSCLVGQFEIL